MRERNHAEALRKGQAESWYKHIKILTRIYGESVEEKGLQMGTK